MITVKSKWTKKLVSNIRFNNPGREVGIRCNVRLSKMSGGVFFGQLGAMPSYDWSKGAGSSVVDMGSS